MVRAICFAVVRLLLFRVQFLSAPSVRRKIWENIFSAFKLTKNAEAEVYFLPKYKKAYVFLCYLYAESVDLQNFLRTLWGIKLFPSAVYRKGKAWECFSMLDSEKQKHRDHCKASVARSVLISATERLSELRSSELSANGRSWMHGSSRKRSRSRVLAFRRQHTQKNNRWFPFRTCARKPPTNF